MKSSFYKGVVLGAVVAALTLGASAALAGSGIGGIFNLGQANSVNATSTLTGSASGKQLQVTNTSTGSAATGIGISVASGKPPLTVNSKTQVPNLNASLLGGKAASAFLPVAGTAANSNELGGVGPSGYYTAGSTVANSNELGGIGPSGYYTAGSTVANSNELGGLPASAYGDRWFAVVPAAGGLVVGNGVSSTQHDGTGSYDVRFTGSIANTASCAVFAQLMQGIGWVVAEPSTEDILTEFDVHVYNTAGNPADQEFSLFAVC